MASYSKEQAYDDGWSDMRYAIDAGKPLHVRYAAGKGDPRARFWWAGVHDFRKYVAQKLDKLGLDSELKPLPDSEE